MGLQANVIINGYSLLLLIAMYIHSKKNSDEKSELNRIFLMMIRILFVLLFFDVMSRCDGYILSFFPLFNQIGNFMVFVMNPILPLFWFYYVYTYIWEENANRQKIFINGGLIVGINTLLVIISQYTGWYYYIDSKNIYYRGSLFIIPNLLAMGILVFTIFYIMYHRQRIEHKHYYTMLFFIFPPLIGLLLQGFIYGFSFILNSVTLSVLMILLNIQNRSLYIDHLTGVYNRKKLEGALTDKIQKSNRKHSFSMMMIDVNDFKEINDTFGHKEGDEALIRIAKLIELAIGKEDILIRYGGDEFCVILKTDIELEIKKILRHIHLLVDKENQSLKYPYKIYLSIGYGIYNIDSKLSSDAFVHEIDQYMYKEKQRMKSS
jgi:diguanylate cyclase (GGDEF)-like protein